MYMYKFYFAWIVHVLIHVNALFILIIVFGTVRYFSASPSTLIRALVCFGACRDFPMSVPLLNMCNSNNADFYNDLKQTLLAEGWQAKVKVTLVPSLDSPGGVWHELRIKDGHRRML